MTGARQPRGAHQSGNPLAAVAFTVRAELGMHTGRAIQVPRRGVDGPYARQQRGIGLRMGRWRVFTPSVIARRGDAEHTRHGGKREQGLVRAHEPEDPDDTAPVSRANQAAAFERMSRSSRS